MKHTLRTFDVTIGSECDGDFEETFRVRATYDKGAEFDAKQEAAKVAPFVDPCDFVVLRTREVK